MKLSTNRPVRHHAAQAGLVTLAALLALVAAAPAGAAQARHVTIEIHESFDDGFLSDACGTEVVVSIDATLNVTLVYNKAGLLVREIDPAGGGKITTSAPLLGNAFSFPFNSVIIDYGAGAAIGSTFTAKFVGLLGHVPGYIASDAGQGLFAGFVDGFDESGIPELQFTELLDQHGNFESGEDVVAAMCLALTA